MNLISNRPSYVPLQAACLSVGLPRSSYYRWLRPPRVRSESTTRVPPRKLTAEEREEIISVLHSPEFADQSPAEIYAKLLDQGKYLASVRTIYRILKSLGENIDRRKQHPARHYVKPMLTAKKPNEVWTWDITCLSGPKKGKYFYLYVVLDLYSRYVVGWMIAEKQTGELASQLISELYSRIGIKPGQLISHSDRGSPMTSDTMAQLLANLGIERSFSRPRVSNDNPFIESHFKTLKYQPDYPGRFGSLLHARGWMADFFTWYNEHHQHEGIAFFTPSDVYNNRVYELAKMRQLALDEAYQRSRERFVHGAPKARLPPEKVSINGDDDRFGQVLQIQPGKENNVKYCTVNIF